MTARANDTGPDIWVWLRKKLLFEVRESYKKITLVVRLTKKAILKGNISQLSRIEKFKIYYSMQKTKYAMVK